MTNRYDFWTNEPIPLWRRAWDHAWPWLVAIPLVTALVVGYAQVASADDWQCTDPNGCTALQSSDSGSRVVKFKRGDIISSQGGWIPDPPVGWESVGMAGPDELAAVLP